jgi:thiol:disulfide interchange protein
MVIFGSLGVGMAAPYLVLSAKPSLVERIPRTGPASELVKQVMGLLLLAAAAYFVGSGALGWLSEHPDLGKSLPWWSKAVHWWLVALFAALAGLWLLIRTFQITPKPGRRVAFTVVALLLGGAAVAYAADTTRRLADNIWTPFDETELQAARERGQVVVVDFTAEWCLNCKALKAAVLERQPVKGELLRPGVVPMVADLTSTKAPGWDKLRDLGQTGIPLLVIYGPGLDEPWQSNAYTSQQVLDALARARGEAGTVAASR